MKLSITVSLFAAGAVGCSHDTRPPSTPGQGAEAEQVQTARVSESAPPAARIPTSSPVLVPPDQPPAPPADQTPLTLTPASGTGSPRSMPTPAPVAPSSNDKADSAEDQESVGEIRALLAADSTLASSAPQLSIVARSGRVWLRGQVNTAAQRAAIEKAARRAVGVIDVRNDLVVME